MSNSSLVSMTKLSPNHSGKRKYSLRYIIPHCFVGQVNVEQGLNAFMPQSKQASCNYVIAKDGKIGLCVDEDNRSWCTSSGEIDHAGITIECASDCYSPYKFNEVVWQKLIDLCTDICKRYGKKKLIWLGDKQKTLSYKLKDDELLIFVHRWTANKACPGDWAYSRLGQLADEVTKRLSGSTQTSKLYRVRKSWADSKSQIGAYKVLENAKKACKVGYTVYDEAGKAIYANVVSESISKSYMVKVTCDVLNIRSGPGTDNRVVGSIRDKGVYTIVETRGNWGKLKSGAGWICLDYTKKC